MATEFTVEAVIPARPLVIWAAWLDGDGHTKMTGGERIGVTRGIIVSPVCLVQGILSVPDLRSVDEQPFSGGSEGAGAR